MPNQLSDEQLMLREMVRRLAREQIAPGAALRDERAAFPWEVVDVLRENGRLENFQAHMHLRGKGMQMTAILPNGRSQVLSRVSDFNFNWHNNYVYADDSAPLLPKGTVIAVKSWWDNTSANRANPDPDQWVGWGDRTVDEMAHAWVNVTYMNDEDFEAAVAERKARAESTDGGGGQ